MHDDDNDDDIDILCFIKKSAKIMVFVIIINSFTIFIYTSEPFVITDNKVDIKEHVSTGYGFIWLFLSYKI